MAHSFFTSNNGRMAMQLVKILEEAGQPVPPELRQFSMTSGGPTSECRAGLRVCVHCVYCIGRGLMRAGCSATRGESCGPF